METILGEWRFVSITDIGDREEQQDRLAIFHSTNHHCHLLVVADGMGGHEKGDWAAQTVLDTASAMFKECPVNNPAQFLRDICYQAHELISAQTGKTGLPPGSTCVILYLTQTEAHWVHVGDSRLYHFQAGRYVTSTRDHSIGQLIKENAASKEGKQNQLYMCLGGDNEITPEYDYAPLSKQDLFILCTDGLWGQLPADLASLDASLGNTLAERMKKLVDDAKQQQPGRSDNISLLAAYREHAPNPGFRRRIEKWFGK